MGHGKYSVFLQLPLSFSELILLIVNFIHFESERFPGVGNGNTLITLAWRIPWTEELGRLQSMERAGHD